MMDRQSEAARVTPPAGKVERPRSYGAARIGQREFDLFVYAVDLPVLPEGTIISGSDDGLGGAIVLVPRQSGIEG